MSGALTKIGDGKVKDHPVKSVDGEIGDVVLSSVYAAILDTVNLTEAQSIAGVKTFVNLLKAGDVEVAKLSVIGGVTGAFNALNDVEVEQIRLGRSDDQTIRYHSIRTKSRNIAASQNYIRLHVHNGVGLESDEQVDVIGFYGNKNVAIGPMVPIANSTGGTLLLAMNDAIQAPAGLVTGGGILYMVNGKLFNLDSAGVLHDLTAAGGGSGDVVGPGSSADEEVAVNDGITGKLLKRVPVKIDSSGNITAIAKTEQSENQYIKQVKEIIWTDTGLSSGIRRMSLLVDTAAFYIRAGVAANIRLSVSNTLVDIKTTAESNSPTTGGLTADCGVGIVKNLQVGGQAWLRGAQFRKNLDISANYNPSLLTTNYQITVINTDSPRTITLSNEDIASGSTTNHRHFIVNDESGGAAAQNITIVGESGQTFNGAANLVINSNYGSFRFYSNGTNLFTT